MTEESDGKLAADNMSAETFRVHPANWDEATIGRFWAYIATRADLHSEYFSNQFGQGIVRFLTESSLVRRESIALDYGCGPGFLSRHLLDAGYACQGVDASPEAVASANSTLDGHPGWRGAVSSASSPAPFPDASFGLVTCIETIEHLLDKSLPEVLQDVRRLLTVRGIALFTTPNAEDLRRNSVYCPFCETEFHSVQHVRSIDRRTLRALLEENGFEVMFCDAVHFGSYQAVSTEWKDLSPRMVVQAARRAARRVGARRASADTPSLGASVDGFGPHLCALAAPATFGPNR